MKNTCLFSLCLSQKERNVFKKSSESDQQREVLKVYCEFWKMLKRVQITCKRQRLMCKGFVNLGTTL